MKQLLDRLRHDRSGATAIEYGLMLSLIVLAMLGALSAFGGEASGMWNLVASQVGSASSQAAA